MNEKTMKILLGVFIFIIIFMIVDCAMSKPKPFTGVIIEKHYVPASTSTGTGVGSNGEVIMTTSSESEKYIVFVRADNGEIIEVKCERGLYFLKAVKDRIDCSHMMGFFTGVQWETVGLK